MKTTRVYDKVIDALYEDPRIISNEGGTRSSKTTTTLQVLIWLCESVGRAGDIASTVSETYPHLKRGAIRDFKRIMVEEGKWNEKMWNKSDSTYTFPNGAIMEFFSADSPDKVLGSARRWLFLNEAINIPFETARQLIIRTASTVFIDYNPAYAFWFHERYQSRTDVITIHSTYLDNQFLPINIIREIESQRSDARWWRVYGEGKVGELAGQIFTFEQIDALPQDSNLLDFYGLDFGFTHDPTALVHIKAHTGRKELYVEECIYKTGMVNDEIADALQSLGIGRYTEIYADCAEPKSIEEISRRGFNIIPSYKGSPTGDRLMFQIQWLQGWKLYVTKNSLNVIKELRNYVWAKDKDGNDINKPIDNYNHCIDAIRYGSFTKLGMNAGRGTTDIRFIR